MGLETRAVTFVRSNSGHDGGGNFVIYSTKHGCQEDLVGETKYFYSITAKRFTI